MLLRILAAVIILPGVAWLHGEDAEENAFTNPTVIRVESNVVLAPTLVMTKSGEIVHGLKHDDFIVRVDGKDQPFHLDESPDTEKISIVVAVQVGGSAKILFENKRKESWESGSILDGLGTMVENFVGAMDAEIAVVTFDSRVSLVQDFTRDLPTVKEKLNGFEGSDNPGVAILDAVDFAFKLFEKTQPGGRNILFLISESRDDHINGKVKIETLSRKLMASNVQVNSIVFQPLRLKVISDLKSNKPAQKDEIKFETTPGRLSAAIRKILSKNTARTFTKDTGGEHILFSGKNSFDAAFINLTNQFRNTYLISFQAPDASSGFNNIQIRLRKTPKDVVIRSRKGYRIDSRNE